MGFFVSPVKMLWLAKNRADIAHRLKPREKDWYFTKEGEDAYRKANGVGAKTYHFYEYLKKLSGSTIESAALLRLAFVLAHTVEGSAMEYGRYPDVINPNKNPLVMCVQNRELSYAHDLENCCRLLLAALHEEKSDVYSQSRGYERLNYCEPGAPLSDVYRIERAIITVFSTQLQDELPPPYLYDIVQSNAPDEEEDEDEGWEEDEDE